MFKAFPTGADQVRFFESSSPVKSKEGTILAFYEEEASFSTTP